MPCSSLCIEAKTISQTCCKANSWTSLPSQTCLLHQVAVSVVGLLTVAVRSSIWPLSSLILTRSHPLHLPLTPCGTSSRTWPLPFPVPMATPSSSPVYVFVCIYNRVCGYARCVKVCLGNATEELQCRPLPAVTLCSLMRVQQKITEVL